MYFFLWKCIIQIIHLSPNLHLPYSTFSPIYIIIRLPTYLSIRLSIYDLSPHSDYLPIASPLLLERGGEREPYHPRPPSLLLSSPLRPPARTTSYVTTLCLGVVSPTSIHPPPPSPFLPALLTSPPSLLHTSTICFHTTIWFIIPSLPILKHAFNSFILWDINTQDEVFLLKVRPLKKKRAGRAQKLVIPWCQQQPKTILPPAPTPKTICLMMPLQHNIIQAAATFLRAISRLHRRAKTVYLCGHSVVHNS